MPEQSYEERTERATPKRRQEAREKGNVPRSNEVNSAAVLLVSALGFIFFGKHMYFGLMNLSQSVFQNASSVTLTPDTTILYAFNAIKAFAFIVAPFSFLVLVGGIAANIIQAGITFSSKALEPKLDKLNPVEGFKKLFALRSFVEMIKGILKMFLIGFVAYRTLKGEMDNFVLLLDQSVEQILTYISSLTFKVLLRTGLVFILLAIADFAYQKYEYEKNLKMTRQEVKDEYKQMEGDPMVKARIRNIQREMARRRMMAEVPEADVVITNPTHYAVALKFDLENMSAPIVVAKGMRKIALKIREIAVDHGVPVVEKPVVARLLYKSAEVGDEIPVEMYQIVAEILAYVYQMKDNKKIINKVA